MVAGYGDNNIVRLNTGKALQIVFSSQFPVNEFLKSYYSRYLRLDKAELEGTYYALQIAGRINYTMEELSAIRCLDEGQMKYLVQDKSLTYKCQLFEAFTEKPSPDEKVVQEYFRLPVKQDGWKQYFQDSIKQLVFGKFNSSNETPAGTVGEIGLAFTGIDVAQDVRDLLADVVNWDTSWSHLGETALDGLALFPLIGAAAKSDEIILLTKHTDKLYEVRKIARVGESVEDAIRKVSNTAQNLVKAAKTGMKQMGDTGYRCMLYAQDALRGQGRHRLKLAYANEFTDAFAKYADDIEALSEKPSLLQKAFKRTMEDCTDASGAVIRSEDEIQETAEKYIKEAIEEAPKALSGEWVKVRESMSEFSRRYQTQITGREGEVWLQNGVKFDGMKDGVLLDAKGKYEQFIDKSTGEFYDWFTGKYGLIDEARRQVNASEGAPIRWYFAEEESMCAIQKLIDEELLKIICIHQPLK